MKTTDTRQSAKQPDLFLRHKYPPGFFAWLDQNEHIYQVFERMALTMFNSGRKRYSARTIIEVIRWNTDLKDNSVTWKINDHYTPGMARWFIDNHPECEGFFDVREREHASDIGRIHHGGQA